MLARARLRYTEEFRMEAMPLECESAHPVVQVARDLGIPDNVLYRWIAQHRQAEAHGTTRAFSALGGINSQVFYVLQKQD
jgi:transposase